MFYSDEMYTRDMNHHLTLCAIQECIPVSRIGYSNHWTNAPETRKTFNTDHLPMFRVVRDTVNGGSYLVRVPR